MVVQQPLPKLPLSAARRTNQSDRPLSIGRLVIQGHFLVGEYLLIVDIWQMEEKEANNNNDFNVFMKRGRIRMSKNAQSYHRFYVHYRAASFSFSCSSWHTTVSLNTSKHTFITTDQTKIKSELEPGAFGAEQKLTRLLWLLVFLDGLFHRFSLLLEALA